MSNETILSESTGHSRFGWSKPARIEEFRKLSTISPSATERIVFKGKPQDFPIIRVSIDLPKYRITNGRTASLQSEYLAKNPKTRPDLFTGDPELWDVQEIQHKLLLQLAKQSDLKKYFEDASNSQVDPILLDENGFVVNGNRRLSTWRDLLHKDPAKYSSYSHIDVVVLPHCDEREIDRLEATLQIERDIRADYSWDSQANMMLAKQQRYHLSNKELADLYGMKESEVTELLDMRSYADEYLKSRNKANFWSLVSEDQFAFQKIARARAKIAGLGNQEFFKAAAFILIDNAAEAGGRLYEQIPSVLENLNEVKGRLQNEFNIKPQTAPQELEEIFGVGNTPGSEDPLSLPLAKEIQKPENVDKTRKIIVEVIESQNQIKKDARTSGYLLECCSKAQSLLTAAVKHGLRAETKIDGVAGQLDQIQNQINKIQAFLNKHAKN